MASQNFFKSLRPDRVYTASVDEALASGDLICSFDGHLVRVANQSAKKLQKGDKVQLLLKTIEPLEFQIIERQTKNFMRVV